MLAQYIRDKGMQQGKNILTIQSILLALLNLKTIQTGSKKL